VEIYLDDCADDDDLVAFLTQQGHAVHTPRSDGTAGVLDPRHLEHAAAHGYTLVTKNPSEFRRLHDAWQAQGRTRSGILLIYQDNIKGKDMKPADIVRAINNLIASGLPVADAIHALNNWR
jgi:hypothetical protein